jgi:hypothetical protein
MIVVNANCLRSRSQVFWATSAAHDESEFPQNLKGLMLLQTLPCAGSIEHGKYQFVLKFLAAAQAGIHHKLAGSHG